MKNTRAFTLIEIIACMGIFAIGFAAIAMMLPAGFVMQRDVEARGLGDIVGRNALEVVKGKGAQSLTFDTAGSVIPLPLALNSGYAGIPAGWDMEAVVRQGWLNSWLFQGYGEQSGPDTMWKYFNTNNDGGWREYLGGSGAYRVAVWQNPDLTHCGLGRIHALAGRGIPGSTLGLYSILDFSFPSTLFDVQARTCFAHVMRTNQSGTPFGAGNWANNLSLPSAHNWQLTVVTTRKGSDDEWPEQAEQDSANAANYVAASASTILTPDCLHSNSPIYFRSRAGDSTLMTNPSAPASTWVGVPDSASLKRWTYYSGPSGGWTNDATVTPYGGAPNATSPHVRGWCFDFYHPTGAPNNGWYANPGYGGGTAPGWDFFDAYISPPLADFATTVPGRTTYRYAYTVPNVVSIPAIVYDRDSDLLLVRWPQVFASNPVSYASNTRLQNFWNDMKMTPAAAPNRKLKVGDSLLGAYGAIPFKVKEVIDPASEYANLPAGVQKDPADPWNDGTYQVIRVSPPISTTPYTANKPTDAATTWTDIFPCSAIVAPAPLAGGPSPWISTQQMNNCNGSVFHNWDDLCN